MSDLIGKIIGGAIIVLGGIVTYLTVKWLITEVIRLAELTIEAIRNTLSRRIELKANNVMCVVVKEFIKEQDTTIVKLEALRSNGSSAGMIKMSSNIVKVSKGDKIKIKA